MKQGIDKPQWALHVIVWHGQSFGHKIELETQRQGCAPSPIRSLGSWKGLGVPESVAELAQAQLGDTLYEHLVTRYGIQEELRLPFSG